MKLKTTCNHFANTHYFFYLQWGITTKSTPVPAAFRLAFRLAGMGGDEPVECLFYFLERHAF
jgi:hypothetical protein